MWQLLESVPLTLDLVVLTTSNSVLQKQLLSIEYLCSTVIIAEELR